MLSNFYQCQTHLQSTHFPHGHLLHCHTPRIALSPCWLPVVPPLPKFCGAAINLIRPRFAVHAKPASQDVKGPVGGIDAVAKVILPLEAVVLRRESGPSRLDEVGADAAADEAEDQEEDAIILHAGVAVGEPRFFVGGGEVGGFEFCVWGGLADGEEEGAEEGVEETEWQVSFGLQVSSRGGV